ncbi:MAG: Hpt domain-containing protein [Candidatus Omnitrophica bacterium]|nr:Hpt domain-containing protein [Candidatus Omnitrophota bacterium]
MEIHNKEVRFLTGKLDKLAEESIIVDLSSETEIIDFEGKFNAFIEDALSNNIKDAAEAARLVLEFLKIAKDILPEKMEEIVFCGINQLYNILKNKTSNLQSPLEIEKNKTELNKILGRGEKGKNYLLPFQLEELPGFIVDADVRIAEIEDNIQYLEKDFNNEENIKSLYRHFHTLAGETSFLGILNFSRLTQKAGDILNKIKNKEIGLNGQLISLLLDITRVLRELLKALADSVDTGLGYDVSAIVQKTADFLVQPDADSFLDPRANSGSQETPNSDIKMEFTPRIPQPDLSDGGELIAEFISESQEHLYSAEEALMILENQGDNDEAINKIFRAFHSIKGIALFLGLEDIKTLTHETETLIELARKVSIKTNPELCEAFFLSIDSLRKLLQLLQEQAKNNGVLKSEYYNIFAVLSRIKSVADDLKNNCLKKTQEKKIGEILLENDTITESELKDSLEKQRESGDTKKIGEILVETKAVTQTQLSRALEEQQTKSIVDETVKISVRKLDDIINNIGELVIVSGQVCQSLNVLNLNSKDIKLAKNTNDLDKIIRNIQNISMTLRFIPVRPLFHKMQRLIRDLSAKTEKQMHVVITGEETEIDRNIIELISDPLTHMVRNSFDHGIEEKEVRVSRGKPAFGRIELIAYHKSGNLIIEVKDDGQGLNKEKILQKARMLGLLKETDALDDKNIYNMIFHPGFSTAEKVTDISGRGVGMDVAKRNIDKLRGKIEINSKPGEGTIFIIKLPLTLGIIDATVVSIGRDNYIIPLFSVVEFVQPRFKNITSISEKKEVIKIHGELFPVIHLDNCSNISYKKLKLEEQIGCLVDSDYGRACILIDAIVGQQQVVIKRLEGNLGYLKGISGATILSDGKVGLILDIDGIISLAHKKNAR